MRKARTWLLALLLAPALAAAAGRLSHEDAVKLLKEMDERHHTQGDLKSLCFIEETKGDQKVIREAIIYHKQDGSGLVMLLTKPKTEEGNGYLRLETNLWSYDARLGRWERRTERERLAGTNLRRSDVDEFQYAAAYEPTDAGEELVGGVMAHKLELRAKDDVDVAFPRVYLWLDKDLNPIKSQEYALSGKLLRTTLIEKRVKVLNKVSNREVWYPKEIRIFDEVEKDRTTTLVIKAIDPSPLAAEIFTKAWLEGKSR